MRNLYLSLTQSVLGLFLKQNSLRQSLSQHWRYEPTTLRAAGYQQKGKSVESYVRRCDVCLALKMIRRKPYDNLQSLPISTHWWKDLSIDFVIRLPLSSDWMSNSYDFILVIVIQLTKMVYYEPVKVTIDTSGLPEVIIDMVVWYHNLANSIISDRKANFTSKFWSLLYYFLGIKQRLSNTFHH